ncbi:TonB-dependent siderophore receptor [Bacterioplanoides sp.]|uniref:TonB-dependent siderophore receptor n=1 Tax=Bacterioplanoides sp. TaxID=2066072 RepID=UPI003B5B977C
MTRHRVLSNHLISATLSLALFPLFLPALTPALAQAESSDSTTLDTIEVVGTPLSRYYVRESQGATRTTTDIMNIPRSVTLIPEQVIIDQQATELADILRNVSSTSEGDGNGNVKDDFGLRGFKSATTYRDGVRVITSKTSTANIEALEVIKGPASVLYGAVQPGGIVNIVTKKPQASPYHLLNTTLDNKGKRYLLADSTNSINDDQSLLYRMVASYEDSETFRDESDIKRTLLSPSLRWHINNQSYLNINYEYQKDKGSVDHGLVGTFRDNNPDNPVIVPNVPISRDYGEAFEFNRSEISTLTLDYDLTFANDWHLTAKLMTQDSDNKSLETNVLGTIHGYKTYFDDKLAGDFSRLKALGLPEAPDGTVLRRVMGSRGDQDNDHLNLSLDKHFDTGFIRHHALVGIDFHDQKSFSTLSTGDHQGAQLQRDVLAILQAVEQGDLAKASQLTAAIPTNYYGYTLYQPVRGKLSSATANKDFDYTTESEHLAVYFQDQLSIGDRLKLLLGARYDDFDTRMNNVRFDEQQSTKGKFSDQQWTYQAGALCKLFNQASLYASYSESFTPQSLFNVLNASKGETKTDLLTPEEGKQYEVGSKFSWFNDKLTMTVSYFDIEKKNILAYVTTEGAGLEAVLLGKQTSKGFEVDTTAQLSEGVNLLASFSDLDIKIDDPGRATGVAQGNKPSNVADTSASLWLSYEPKNSSWGNWGVGAGTFYVGDRYGTNRNTWKLDGYTTSDVSAWYYIPAGDGQLKMQFGVQNLADERYFIASGARKERIKAGSPRTFSLSLSYLAF